MRSSDAGRTYTMVFFTDGQPTWGETQPGQDHRKRQEEQHRQYAHLQLRRRRRCQHRPPRRPGRQHQGDQHLCPRIGGHRGQGVAACTPRSAIPVLANLKMTRRRRRQASAKSIRRSCPISSTAASSSSSADTPARGKATVKLTGTIGKETKEFVYELNFADKTGNDKAFVEDLWARRKVGYLLDQIRVQGESKEVVDEVVQLAKRYGITTPYTSYLLVSGWPVPRSVMKMPDGLRPGAGGGPADARGGIRQAERREERRAGGIGQARLDQQKMSASRTRPRAATARCGKGCQGSVSKSNHRCKWPRPTSAAR